MGVALLSVEGNFTVFEYDKQRIRFKTSSRLVRYTEVVEWDAGYLVVMAEYLDNEAEEEYIDLLPILENLYFDAKKFLGPIERVKIKDE